MRSVFFLATAALLFGAGGAVKGAASDVLPGTKAQVPADEPEKPATGKPAAEKPHKPAVQVPPVKAATPAQKIVLPTVEAPAAASGSSEEAEYRRKARDAQAQRAEQEFSRERAYAPAKPASSASEPRASKEPEGPIDPNNPGGPQVDPDNPAGPQKTPPPK